MATKYSEEFNREARRIVKNYNARVKKLKSKYPTSRKIPAHVTVKGLKSAYTSKTDLKRKLRLLESFSEDKMNMTVSVSRDHVNVSKYDFQTYKLNKKIAQGKIKHLLERNQQKDRMEGRFLPSHRTRALQAQLDTLQRGDVNKSSYESYRASKRMASRYTDKREETDQQFYTNFFNMLWANQTMSDIDPELVSQAEQLMKKLSPEQLLEMYNSEPDVQRLVEDYNMYIDSQGEALTDTEQMRSRIRFEMLMDELPALVEKYSKI